MTTSIPILALDNTFTFGGAINSLGHLFGALDKEHFVPVLVTGQPSELLSERFPGCTCYHRLPRLPWVDNRGYLRLASLPPFRRPLLRKGLNLARFCYWHLAVSLPEAWDYYRLGKKHRVRLVHLNNILGSQFPGILAAKALRVPIVAHLRDFEEIHPVTRFYAGLIDHHVAISAAIRDNLLELGVPAERISVVHDAIDLGEFAADLDAAPLQAEFGLEPGQPRFGIFGRVVDWKGIREFLLAARQVVDRFPRARAFVVGSASDGEEAYFDEMRQLAGELGLGDRVIFTGYRRDVGALMKLMDVVVHASVRPEPFGMVIIEGMAMGKPVVATRAGGPLDIVVEEETGLLVPPGDADALAVALTELLSRPEAARTMGEHGRRRVEDCFASPLYAARIEGIYQQTLERWRHGRKNR